MENLLLHGIFSFMAALGFGILFHIRAGNLVFSALGGMVGWIIFIGMTPVLPDDIVRYFVASVVVSIYAQRMAFFRKAPALVFLVVAFIPLVPGYAAYKTMEAILLSDMPQFVESGLYTFKVVMAIATGFLISSSVLVPMGAVRVRGRI